MKRKAIDAMINCEIPDKLLSIEKSKINLAKFTNTVLKLKRNCQACMVNAYIVLTGYATGCMT